MTRCVRATYRLQLHPGLTFADAARLVPQLAELGISHLYLSPCLEAVPGSTHGYDVVDPTRIRAELGGEAGLRQLAATAHHAGLGLVLDIVPNHVGLVSPHNPWWWDILAHGPGATYGRHLDIDWRPGPHGQPTLLLPELGRPLEDELERDELRLDHDRAGRPPHWRIIYHEHVWPVAPGSLEAIGLDPDEVDGTLATVRGDRSRLAELLGHQHYRLAWWRRANDELDHRRFFDVSTLGAVRVEDPQVFDDVHAAVLPLVHEGVIDGLRIDHPDGLSDPVGYVRRLRDAAGPRVWIIVEKILHRHERLRGSWPVDGTVGYEFADLELGVHVDPDANGPFDALRAALSGHHLDRDGLADTAKRKALAELFGAERRRLVDALCRALDDPPIEAATAEEALGELLIAWPVYRTYVRPQDGEIEHADREVVDRAIAHVRASRPHLSEHLDAVRALFRLEHVGDDAAEVVERFQQLTGPLMAKGLEDTLLYRDLRFVAINEVGGDTTQLGRDAGELHRANGDAQANRPATMRLSSTHDTKRSEDVRARLAVLSQLPDRWVAFVHRLIPMMAARHPGQRPSPDHELLALQTAVGAWPIDRDRLGSYLVKAAREGKQETDWLDPDLDYEQALTDLATILVEDAEVAAQLEALVQRIEEPGRMTSLSMLACKLTAPGVPDTYQG
ncbi:MAG: malto-oligosyltrehalose synthase, partial [Actinomycetota bacterium]